MKESERGLFDSGNRGGIVGKYGGLVWEGK